MGYKTWHNYGELSMLTDDEFKVEYLSTGNGG